MRHSPRSAATAFTPQSHSSFNKKTAAVDNNSGRLVPSSITSSSSTTAGMHRLFSSSRHNRHYNDDDAEDESSFLQQEMAAMSSSKDNKNRDTLHTEIDDASAFLRTVTQPESSDSISGGDSSTSGTAASIPNLVTSLIKSIIGSGVLALPAGMAAMGDRPHDVLPFAYVLIVLSAVLNAGFFVAIGRVCTATQNSQTFPQAWDRSVGPEYAVLVTWVITLKTFLSCLAFSMIVADSGAAWLNIDRTVALWSGTILAILPLSLLKDIQSLAPFSALGLAGMAVTSLAMIIRSIDGKYDVTSQGLYTQSLPEYLQPQFGTVDSTTKLKIFPVGSSSQHHDVSVQGSLVLACSLATALMAHYNAPRFHAELRNPTPARFQQVTGLAYGVSALVMALVATAGYVTFGGHAQGLILNNYASNDPLINVARAALSFSIVLTYPLPFVGLRDGCLSLLLMKKEDSRRIRSSSSSSHSHHPPTRNHNDGNSTAAAYHDIPRTQNDDTPSEDNENYEIGEGVGSAGEEGENRTLIAVSVGLLLGVTLAATFVRDLGIVISVGGGTFSTAVASIFPTLMLTSLYNKNNAAKSKSKCKCKSNNTDRTMIVTDDDADVNNIQLREVAVAWIGMLISVVIGMTGVWFALAQSFTSSN